jgi:hypothetical protein
MATRERWREQAQLKVATAATTGKIWQRRPPRRRRACLAERPSPRARLAAPRPAGYGGAVTATNSTGGVEEPRSLRPQVCHWRRDAAIEWGGLNGVVVIVSGPTAPRRAGRAPLRSLLACGPTTTGPEICITPPRRRLSASQLVR